MNNSVQHNGLQTICLEAALSKGIPELADLHLPSHGWQRRWRGRRSSWCSTHRQQRRRGRRVSQCSTPRPRRWWGRDVGRCSTHSQIARKVVFLQLPRILHFSVAAIVISSSASVSSPYLFQISSSSSSIDASLKASPSSSE